MKNKLNVFTYGYYTWKYINNWPHNFINFFKTIKWAFQRAIKGYCDLDIYNLNEFYRELFIMTLIDLDNSAYGFPTGLTEEKWHKILKRMIECFKKADDDRTDIENPYYIEYLKLFDTNIFDIVDFQNYFNYPDDKTLVIRDNYLMSAKLIYEDVEKNRREALKLFSKWFKHLFN